MPPRKFGIEFELCLNLPERFDIFRPPTFDKQLIPYLAFLHDRYPDLPEPVKEWCDTFGNSLYIYTIQAKLLYNFKTGETEDSNVERKQVFQYDKPILIRDVSVVCHSNFEKLYYGNKNIVNGARKEYRLNDTSRFTANVEFITQKLSSFEEWEYFKQAIMPPEEVILRNKSQGIHLNIGVEDLPIEQLKEILLIKYAPWEAEYASLVRPYESDFAQILYDKNLMNLTSTKRLHHNKLHNIYNESKKREAINGILFKEKSVHLKPQNILEFRIFSTLGENVEDAMKEVYSFFPPVAEGGSRRSQSRKKLKRAHRTRRGHPSKK